MTNVAVDLVTVDDDERRSRRDDRRRIGGLLFLGAIVAVLSAKSGPVGSRPGTLAVDPALIDFGKQSVGTTVTRKLSFTNHGATAFVAKGVAVEAMNNPDFAISAGSCAQLDPNQTCSAEVTFAPRATGTQTTTLALLDASGSSNPVQVTGTGIVARGALRILGDGNRFADQLLGTRSAPSLFAIENSGDAAVRIVSVRTDREPFQADGCRDAILRPRSRCEVAVTFTPVARETVEAQLLVTDERGATVIAPLSGRGIIHRLLADTQILAFTATGNIDVKTVTFTNAGDDLIAIGDVQPTGQPFTKAGDTCSRTTLRPGGACKVSVVSRGAGDGKLVVPAPNGTDEAVVLLQASQAPPPLLPQLRPDKTRFSFIAERKWSDTLTIHNDGRAPLVVTSATIDPQTERFTVQGNQCAKQPVAPGGTCAILVVFNPSISFMSKPLPISQAARLRIESNAPSSPDFVDLGANANVIR